MILLHHPVFLDKSLSAWNILKKLGNIFSLGPIFFNARPFLKCHFQLRLMNGV